MWNRGWRDEAWSRLENEPFDVIVVGGGVTGAGILRFAARAGLRVALIEQRDFAWGASSRSSKLVHGGLRYLLQGQIGLLRESVVERAWLYKEVPGLVEPLGFLVAVYDGDRPGKWGTGAGMRLADLLGGTRQFQEFSRDDLLMLVPQLRRAGLRGGFRLVEMHTDDARLVLRLLREAAADGAVVLNYAMAERLMLDNARVTGVAIRDGVADRSLEVRAPVVINATGVWADSLREQVAGSPMMRPLRGSHLVLPHARLPLYQEVTFRHPVDRRFVFAYPWDNCTLVGTTDLDHDGSLAEEPAITFGEIAYLLEAMNTIFPGQPLSTDDVISTYAGVRPVVGAGTEGNPSRMSRDHVLQEENGLLTVTGGKLSTFRVTASQVLRHLESRFPGKAQRAAARSMFTSPPPGDSHSLSVDAEDWKRLAGRYGAEAPAVLDGADAEEMTRVPGLRALWAEVRWAARSEGVVHLDDLLLRRLRIGNLVPNGGRALLPRIKEICRLELGWDDERWKAEEVRYMDLYRKYYTVPGVG